MTAREGNMGNCHPEKTMSTEAKPRLTLVFEGWQFSMCSQYLLYYTECKLNTSGFKTIQVKWIYVCISYSVNSNAHTTPVWIYGKPYAHKFFAVNIFLKYPPSSSNITCCQVPSRVRAWFHHSVLIFMTIRQRGFLLVHNY